MPHSHVVSRLGSVGSDAIVAGLTVASGLEDSMERIRNRQSGVICHPTSFPGPHGIGDFGEAAFRYVDWLARGKQTLWQVLPLGPTGLGNSPYASPSAFAGMSCSSRCRGWSGMACSTPLISTMPRLFDVICRL